MGKHKYDHSQFRDLWRSGLPIKEIAKIMEANVDSLYQLRLRLRLKKRLPRGNPTGIPPISIIGKKEWDRQYRALRGTEYCNAMRRAHIKRYREQLLKLISNGVPRCMRCGINDMRVLTFDHINNDGREDREKFTNGGRMVAYYVRHPKEAKKKLQSLCRNCNWIKRLEMLETQGV